MPYNYFPTGYQPVYPYQLPQTAQPTVQAPIPPVQTPAQHGNSGLIWVQGESGAKSYLVAPNTTVMLMDSEVDQFFLKSADASGMPLPLRTFRYEEVKNQPVEQSKAPEPINLSKYVEKDEYEAFKRRVEGLLNAQTEQPKREERRPK